MGNITSAKRQETYPSPVFPMAVPSDSTVLEGVRSLYVVTAGNLNLVDQKGNTTLFPVVIGQTLLVQPSKVLATDTTATCALFY